jgi:hypothetical protein
MSQLRLEMGMDSEIYYDVICDTCAEAEGNDEWTWLWDHIEDELRDAEKREAALDDIHAAETVMTKLDIPTDESWWIGKEVRDVNGRVGHIVKDNWAKIQGMKASGLLNWIPVSDRAAATHRVWTIDMGRGKEIEVSNALTVFGQKQLFDPYGIIFYDSRDVAPKGLRKSREEKWVPLSAHPKTAYGVGLIGFDKTPASTAHTYTPHKSNHLVSPAFNEKNIKLDLETRNRVFGDRHIIKDSERARWSAIQNANKHPYFMRMLDEEVRTEFIESMWESWQYYYDSWDHYHQNPRPPLANLQQDFLDYTLNPYDIWENNCEWLAYDEFYDVYIEGYYRTPAELQDLDIDMSFSDVEEEIHDITQNYFSQYIEPNYKEWMKDMWNSENSSSRAESLMMMTERLPNESVQDWAKRVREEDTLRVLTSGLYTMGVMAFGIGLGWYVSKKYLG